MSNYLPPAPTAGGGGYKAKAAPSPTRKSGGPLPGWLRRLKPGNYDKAWETNTKKTPERAESVSTAAPKAKTLSDDRQRRRDAMIAAAKRRTDEKPAQNKVRKNTPTNYYKMRSENKAVQAERQQRIGQHRFKGDYYGPDAFKGDQKKIDKWKAAGKPKDKSKFV